MSYIDQLTKSLIFFKLRVTLLPSYLNFNLTKLLLVYWLNLQFFA